MCKGILIVQVNAASSVAFGGNECSVVHSILMRKIEVEDREDFWAAGFCVEEYGLCDVCVFAGEVERDEVAWNP